MTGKKTLAEVAVEGVPLVAEKAAGARHKDMGEVAVEGVPILVEIPAAGRSLGVRRSSVYKLLDAGELESVKIGTRRLVVSASITAYVDRLVKAGESA